MYEQESLFDHNVPIPLAERMRPETLDEFVGQESILGKGKSLRNAIEADTITSMILWGPPGVGKTTLARMIATLTSSEYFALTAGNAGTKEVKEVIERAKKNKSAGIKTILFIDEIHRFNKAQQDCLLQDVENGNLILIGATTENPSFEVNSALLSRTRVFVLHSLTDENIRQILEHAIKSPKGYAHQKIKFADTVLPQIVSYAGGDARTALNLLESVIAYSEWKEGIIVVSDHAVSDCTDRKLLYYDKKGEEHYNIISALHKSMRNSDPDAALYWMARMFEGGEDPLYIARRLIRFASEDIGIADYRALQVAVNAYEACHYIGRPDCNVNLAQAVVYLSLAPKSNALYIAYGKAREDAVKTANEPVPMQIRNAPTKLMDDLGYGKGYEYAHDYKDGITQMECLPEKLRGHRYYEPTQRGDEKIFGKRLEAIEEFRHHSK